MNTLWQDLRDGLRMLRTAYGLLPTVKREA